MTTIILTIIGILLAAAAALMVIFYGGDAFNAGSIGAQANTLQNAGTNVISAVQLQKAETGLSASSTVAGLISGKYLKEVPSLTGLGVAADDISKGQYTVVLATASATDTANADAVCARINKNLKLGATVASTDAVKMGCDTVKRTFFANL